MKTFSKILMTIIALIGFGLTAQAQLHVDAQGEVGIGTTAPTARLQLTNTGTTSAFNIKNYNYYTGTSAKYGMYTYVNASGSSTHRGLMTYTYGNTAYTGTNYGMYNYLRSPNGYAYGSYNYVYGPTSTDNRAKYAVRAYVSALGNGSKFGVYTSVSSSGGGAKYGIYSSASTYAGYFSGNVYVSGTLTNPSDRRLKENISSIDNALDIVKQLEAKKYTYKKDLGMNLPEGEQYGFIAQDLELVLPAAVKDTDAMIETQESSRAAEDLSEEAVLNGEVAHAPEAETQHIKSVNYIAIIPILVEAIKEQQKQIEELKAKIE